MILLEFLGRGSAYNPDLGNTSACFLLDDTFFLLDCGETVFRELFLRGRLSGVRHAVILITHTHSDHIGSLGTLISYLRHKVGADVTVAYPAKERLRALLDVCNASPDDCRMLGGEDGWELAGVRITPFAVRHSPGMPAYGYVLTHEDHSVYYSGDASRTPGPVLQAFLDGKIQRMYIDCCVAESQDHGTLARHCVDIPQGERGRVRCMHLSRQDMDAIRAAGFLLVGQEEQ